MFTSCLHVLFIIHVNIKKRSGIEDCEYGTYEPTTEKGNPRLAQITQDLRHANTRLRHANTRLRHAITRLRLVFHKIETYELYTETQLPKIETINHMDPRLEYMYHGLRHIIETYRLRHIDRDK